MKHFIHIFSVSVLLTTTASALEIEEGSGSGLQIGVRTDEERIEFLQEVAQVYFMEQDFESAVTAYERILEIDPKHKRARYVVAHTYISAKQYSKAEAQLKELMEEFPDDFSLFNNLAWLYATAEDPDFRNGPEAIRLAQEAMVLAPDNHNVWSTLSEAYYICGDYEKAHRAIVHMAYLATRGATGVTEEQVKDYNEQIRKCKRAWDTQKILRGEDPGEEDS